MKKISLISVLLLMCKILFAQSSTLDLSTGQTVSPASSDWHCINPTGVTFTQSTFYGHQNWLAINNPQVTTYTFVREFWVCKSDGFTISIPQALGDNHLKVYLDGTQLINYNVTTSQQFNTPAKYKDKIKLKCGKHTIKVTVKNHGADAGFMLNCIISGINGGLLSNGKCDCKDCCDKDIDARANVTITCNPGSSAITATGMTSVTGLGQGWVLKKVNCPLPSICSWMAGPITAQGTGPNFSFNGLQVGSCYILTHYVNKCSKRWDPKDCRASKTICFTVSCPQMKTTNGSIAPRVLPIDNIKFEGVTPEMEKEILSIKGN